MSRSVHYSHSRSGNKSSAKYTVPQVVVVVVVVIVGAANEFSANESSGHTLQHVSSQVLTAWRG